MDSLFFILNECFIIIIIIIVTVTLQSTTNKNYYDFGGR